MSPRTHPGWWGPLEIKIFGTSFTIFALSNRKIAVFAVKKMKSAFPLEQSGTKVNGTLISMFRYTCVPKIGSFGCRYQCTWSYVR